MIVSLEEPILVDVGGTSEFIVIKKLDLSSFKYGQIKAMGNKYCYGDDESAELKGEYAAAVFDLTENGVWAIEED